MLPSGGPFAGRVVVVVGDARPVVPRPAGNVAALARGESELPYARVRGKTSSIAPPVSGPVKAMSGPRDHA